ncbi:MAG: TonB-dependent receptor [Sphingomonas sp.]|uniref:TonB-dependent receptor domain-containing protein n=1 Tax=Sphingomonas sp. TaxID=28214 RepID=UPI00180F41C6|nr:TonB-dependent receptor [Sphingomonas sp.]MBA3666201.1 TonB-dependent receptor [Sphingomonas sp.]
MNKFKLLGTTVLHSAAFTGAIMIALPAMAQQTAGSQDPPATLTSEQEVESGENADCTANPSAAGCQAIVVTGSRIRRPNLDSALPVTSISGEEFFETGNVSIGDTLNDLPALRSTFSQSNSTRFLGTAGLNLLDLRGLGTVRTLVLQNGRRHVGGDVLNSGVTPDVNTIPTDLIERVDVVTGGNSAVYGSDAIAGVVNFILKDDYEGAQLRAQGGASKYGDAGSYFISGLWGTNFADGRGNVAVNAEYARQEQYFGAGRPFLARNNGFLVVDTDPIDKKDTPELENADGTPDRLFFRDIRSASLTNTGVVRFGGTTAANSCGADPLGGRYPCVFIFQPNGTLIPATGERTGLTPGSFVGGNSENFRGGRQFQLAPQLDRYNINLLAHYDVSDAITPFVEAKYSRTDSVGSGSSGPAFIQGGTLGDPFQFNGGRNREQIRLDNPFLSPQARTLICEQRALSKQGCTNATQISIRENLLGLGSRTEAAKRETFRIVGGVRGNFWDDWNYEVSANYGRLKEETKILGNLDVQRFLLANDAVDQGVARGGAANGNIVCRSQVDPNAAFGYSPWVYGTDPNANARLAADIAACTPVNVLGGNFTQAQRDYVLRNTIARGKTSQLDFQGFVGGNTGKFLNLPGGPISFVVGAEYRAENVFYDQDDDVSLGYTFYNAIPTFKAKKSKVKEAFGEIRIPILKDTPFFNELEISGAARVSNYNIGNTGTVWAYNASAIWAPVKDVRFRANYGRSVRAPNQVELFSLPGQNFAPAFGDPCSSINIATGSSNRATNCAAAGRPGGTDATTNPSRPGVPAPNPTGPFDFRYDSSLELVSGGNTELQAEKADSYTVGVVVTPTFVPGFSVSVDYYNINVKKVITSPTPQAIINACYDLSDLNNQFCSLFQRAPAGGANSGEQAFRIIEGSLFQQPLNFANLVAKGIDFEVAYRGQLGDVGRLDTRLTYTHVLDRSNFLDPTDPKRKNVIVGKKGGELGDPRDSFNWNTSFKRGVMTFGYQMRYLSAMYLNTYEDFNSVQGRPPENADYADRQKYPAVSYHDVRLSFDATKDYNFYLGVDNVTNRHPPLGLTGIGGGSSIYDNRGRFFYAGAVAKF